MSNLQIREVNFNGDTLLAVQKDQTVYVGIRWICKALSFDDLKTNNQITKVRSDKVLSKGFSKIKTPTNGGEQTISFLQVDFLPLYLAKINVNTIANKDIQEKLVEYQLRAKDVLADAFLPSQFTQQANTSLPQLPQTYQEALRMLADTIDENERLKPKAKSYDKFLSATNVQNMNYVAKCLKTGRNRLFRFLRNKGVLMKDNVPYQRYISQGYFTIRERTVCGFNTVQTLVTAKGVDFIGELIEN